MISIILSIKPSFTKQILLGNKTIELRKQIGVEFVNGSELYLYSSSPTQAIVGKAVISTIRCLNIDEIIANYLTRTCVSEEYIRKYYFNRTKGYALSIDKVIPFFSPVSLSELRLCGFHPPQSFCYARGEVLDMLRAVK
ncbi:hypothetical protein ACVBIL_02320 [Shewanella sp. 125m-7]